MADRRQIGRRDKYVFAHMFPAFRLRCEQFAKEGDWCAIRPLTIGSARPSGNKGDVE
jgi:hypothetical protein